MMKHNNDEAEYRVTVRSDNDDIWSMMDEFERAEYEARLQRGWEVFMTILIAAILVLALYLIFASILPDIGWCMDNYATSQVPHCYFYENSLWGRFINPVSGLQLPW